jgi:predicted small secreted protein
MPRRMQQSRPRIAALACLLAGLAALTGCNNTREHKAGREGLPKDIGHVEYNVFITRELNLRDVEDSGYYKGPEAPPGFALYGVFLQACNTASAGPHWTAASRFQIEDTQGNIFKPLPLPPDNLWAYRATSLKHGACIPTLGSLASSGPTSGSLLIFKLPIQTLENRPLDLRITSPADAAGTRESGLIELDI